MQPETEHESRLDIALSWVLRIGLVLAIFTILTGSSIFLWRHSHKILNYHVFDGEPASLDGVWHLLDIASQEGTLALMQLGILFLIATPIMRVLSCLIVFSAERDLLYVCLSALVLTVLLLSFL